MRMRSNKLPLAYSVDVISYYTLLPKRTKSLDTKYICFPKMFVLSAIQERRHQDEAKASDLSDNGAIRCLMNGVDV